MTSVIGSHVQRNRAAGQMRGSDGASRYVRVPSDEDEESVGRRLNAEHEADHIVVKPNNNGVGAVSTATATRHGLSCKRRVCLAASLAACVAYVIVMLRLPCNVAPCPALNSTTGEPRWTSPLPSLLESTMDMVTSFEGLSTNLTTETQKWGPKDIIG